MTRPLILTALLMFTIGCGDKTEQNAPTANNMSSETYVRPADEKIGTATMKQFSEESGLKIYPGSESAVGDKFSHGEGVTKTVISYSTSDPVAKIAEFYKAEGMDIKNPSLPIGATKLGAQVMVSISTNDKKQNVVKITGLVSGKKSP